MTRTLAKTIALAALLTLCFSGAALADFDDGDWCGSVPRWPIPPGPYHHFAVDARINPALGHGVVTTPALGFRLGAHAGMPVDATAFGPEGMRFRGR